MRLYQDRPAFEPQEILLIDANRGFCETLTDYLADYGYTVTTARSGREGIDHLMPDCWRAIILDLTLPDQDGFGVLRQIRSRCDTPLLVHATHADEHDVVAALEAGADGFLHKGSCARHLLARLRAILRRTTVQPQKTGAREIMVAGLRIVPEARSATLHGQPVVLTRSEFDILHSLARACGQIKTRAGLLLETCHRNYETFDRAIDVHVSSLRRKLGDDPRHPRLIRTVHSVGYMLVGQSAA